MVQGVGFRPFISRIATRSGVKGYVKNLGGGEVLLYIEGDDGSINKFFELFKRELPPPAEIFDVRVESVEPCGMKDFRILKSDSKTLLRSIVPPDIAICEWCLEETRNPRSRWWRYPFNSCAWCGPRFSIMYATPYDRENTSMRDFPLCSECSREYNDVSNARRYHAEGISCPKCGPKVWLADSRGRVLETQKPIEVAAELIDDGSIVAIKGIGGFHIACRADDDEIVLKLRARKRRLQKPFALMVLSLDVAREIVEMSEEAARLLASPQRPIVLLPKREGSRISEHVAPGLDMLGVMLPYTGLHYILLERTKGKVLIMTSGNAHGKPMEAENDSAIRRLGGIADYFLLHNRKIVNRVDDSVLRLTGGRPVFLRRGRGYAPKWITLARKVGSGVIAFGAELQNAGAVGFEDKAVLTQFIGDTDDFETLVQLERYLEWFVRAYRLRVEDSVIVVDKHPRYNSAILGRKWTRRYGCGLLEVQHHVAHAYSALAEYGKSCGVAIVMDGAGYGDDGNIWGGEVLALFEDGSYRRVAHLQYHKMLGGDLAAIYPARMVFSMLASELGVELALDISAGMELHKHLRSGEELEILANAYSIEKVQTSSTGRVLDAFATVLGVCAYRSYEGEPAMKLEAYSRGGSLVGRVLKLLEPVERGGVAILPTGSALVYAIESLLSGGAGCRRDLGYSIQYAIGWRFGEIAARQAQELGLREVFVSGGAAVNDIIFKGIVEGARSQGRGIEVYVNRAVPPGDGGIALGQVYAAAFMKCSHT
uniref:Carbamoyltransferase n=1 Tax=Fervidicoccus fontis TaxID=683846 RepID=A0A7J3ZLM9_9CREN